MGIDETEYRVHALSASGFAITPAEPIGSETVVHACFRVGAGLSISLQATARFWLPGSDRQWFEFGAVDREILNLLLTWSETSIVH